MSSRTPSAADKTASRSVAGLVLGSAQRAKYRSIPVVVYARLGHRATSDVTLAEHHAETVSQPFPCLSRKVQLHSTRFPLHACVCV